MAKQVNTNVYTEDSAATILNNGFLRKPIKLSKPIELLVNETLPQGTRWDDSNIYTTIDPTENDIMHLCTSPTMMTSKKDSEGNVIINRIWNPNTPTKVNIRMGLMTNMDIANGTPYKWTGIDGYVYPNEYPYQIGEYTGQNVVVGNPNQTSGLMKFQCINDCDIRDLSLNVQQIAFINMQTGAITTGNLKDYKPEDNTPAGSLYDEHLWETGYHSDGVRACVGFGTRVNLWYGTDGHKQRHNQYSGGSDFCIVAEYFHNGELYYAPLPYLSPYVQQTMMSTSSKMLDTTDIVPYHININALIDTEDDAAELKCTLHTPYYYGEEFEMDDYKDFYIDPNNNNWTIKNYTYYKLLLAITRWSGGSMVTGIKYPAVSLKMLFQTLAATCIPFRIENGFLPPPDNFDDTFYCGVKNDNLQATCSWVQGEAIEDILSDEYIPEDFKPIDPEDPDGPEADDDPELIGEPPKWGGSSTMAEPWVDGFELPPNTLNLYALTSEQVAEFTGKLWASFGDEQFLDNMWATLFSTGTLDTSNIVKYMPILRVYPFDLTNTEFNKIKGPDKGNISFGTGAGPIVMSGNVRTLKSCLCQIGRCTIKVPEAKDWTHLAPYAEALLYIPFCGFYPLNITDIVGTEIDVVPFINFLNGELFCVVERHVGQQVNILFTVSGNIGMDIPLSADATAQKIATLTASIAVPALTAGALGAVSGGRALAGMERANSFSKMRNAQIAGSNAARLSNMGSELAEIGKGATKGAAAIAGGAAALGANMTGGMGFAGMPGQNSILSLSMPRNCYIYLRNTRIVKSKKHGSAFGYPSKVGRTIKQLSGWTVVTNPKLTGITATAEELAEIENILTSGFYA